MWVAIGQFSVALVTLVGIRIVTEIAPASILGEATLWLGAITLLRNIFISPLGNFQIRFHAEYQFRKKTNWFTGEISRLNNYLFVISSMILIIIFLCWVFFSKERFNLLLLLSLVIYLVSDVYRSIKLNRLSAERKQGFAAGWQFCDSVLSNGLLVLFLIIMTSSSSYIMGQAVGALIGLIIFGYFLYPQSKPDINEDLNNRKVLLEKLKEYGLPFVVLAVVNWILNLGNRYILGAYNGLVDVGLFTVAFSIASRPFIMISSVMSSFFRPILFQAESNRDSSKASTIFSYWMAGISIIGSLGVTGFLFFGDTIAKLLLAEEYRVQAPSLFKWICIGYALYGIIQTIENRILSFGKSRRIILPSIIGAIINIFAGIILIPILGIIGAAQSVFFSFFIQMLVITFILFKQKNEKGTTLNK